MNARRRPVLLVITIFYILFISSCTNHVPNHPKPSLSAIKKQVDLFNNLKKYDSSLYLINEQLMQKSNSSEEKFQGYILRSNIFKQIYNYNMVQSMLDSAEKIVNQTIHKPENEINIKCLRAFALFDIHKYTESQVIMDELLKNPANIPEQKLAILLAQKAYLLSKSKQYEESKQLLLEAEKIMLKSSPQDMPVIYQKLTMLSGKMKSLQNVNLYFNKGIKYAKEFGVKKYEILMYQSKSYALQNLGLIDSAFKMLKFETQGLYDNYLNSEGLERGILMQELNLSNQKLLAESSQRQNTRKNYILVVVGLSVLLILALLINLYNRQQKRHAIAERKLEAGYSKNLLENTELERSRIARDLHDDVGNIIISIIKSKTTPQEISINLQSVLSKIRSISRDLFPAMFEQTRLKLSLEQLIVQNNNSDLFIVSEINYPENTLNVKAELQIYRIVQEGISNIIKHSKSESCKIALNILDNSLELLMKDNGIGFEPSLIKQSFGLQSIQHRCANLGADLQITSEKGTEIIIKIPINKNN